MGAWERWVKNSSFPALPVKSVGRVKLLLDRERRTNKAVAGLDERAVPALAPWKAGARP